MATSNDVAKLAGVSQSTVSYVLTGRRPISASTRRRVEAAMDELGFQPNAGARALASHRTRVIGLVVPLGPDRDTSGLVPFIESIVALARRRDHDVLLVTEAEGPSALTRLGGRALCDAIVLMDVPSQDPRIPVARSLDVPVVLIGVPEDPLGLPCIDLDFAEAGRLAVDELVDTGHSRIVLVGYTAAQVQRDLNFVRRLQDAVAARCAQRGVAFQLVSPVEPTAASAGAAVEVALAGGPGTALFVSDVLVLSRVFDELGRRGLVPGRDTSVVALCTDRAALASVPPVTNVSLEPRDVSRRAMAVLFDLLEATTRPSRLDAVEQDPAVNDRAAQDPGPQLVTPRLTRRSTTVVPRPSSTVPSPDRPESP